MRTHDEMMVSIMAASAFRECNRSTLTGNKALMWFAATVVWKRLGCNELRSENAEVLSYVTGASPYVFRVIAPEIEALGEPNVFFEFNPEYQHYVFDIKYGNHLIIKDHDGRYEVMIQSNV